MALTKAQLIDLNGNELILDLDADTSITADTDDQIDIKIGGADDFRFTANTFTALSGSTIAAQALTATSITSTGNVVIPNAGTIGSASDADSIAISSGGVVTFSQSPVFPDGSLAVVDLDIDGATDIGAAIVDADLFIIDDGAGGTNRKVAASRIKTYIGSSTAADDLTIGDAAILLTTSSGNITVDAAANDSDIIFKGTDGGSDTTFLTIDGSAAGDATFNNQVIVGDGKLVLNSTAVTSTAAEINLIDGGTSRGTTAVADADGLLTNDGGTMRMTSAATFKTYFQEGISTAYDDLTTGDAAVTIDTTSGNITVDSNAGLVSIDGHTGVTLASSNSGDITLDSVADINLDAGGADIVFKDGGTQFGKITNASTHITIFDGTTLNTTMAGANITFAGTVDSGAITSTGIVTGTGFTAGSATLAESELELLDGLTAGTAIASKVVTTDSSIDTSGQRNLTISGELDAATLDISGAIDIAGASQFGGTITVGANDAGHDVIFHGNAASANVTFDASADDLIFNGGAGLIVPDGQFTLASTAVTSTAAELNKLDGAGVLKQAGKETIWIPANAMVPTASNGCAALTTVETTSGRPDMNVLDFDKDSDEFAQFAVAFPKSYNLGTVTFQFFWSGIAATTGVNLTLAGVAMNDNQTIDVAYGTAVAVADDAQGAVEELLVSAESGAITIAGTMADNDLAYFRIGRDVSADNMAGDCRLHGIKLHFTTDAANDA